MDNLQTGDLILFHGRHNLFDRLIEYFTSSNYSHIGMIIKDPKFTIKPLVGLFFWESSDENIRDVEDNHYKIGVEIVPLEQMLKNEIKVSDLYYRKLNHNLQFSEETFKHIHKTVHDKPYDIMPLDWLEAYYREDSHPQKTDRFWCSALVGYIYTQLGLLPSNTDWSVMRPSDFSSQYNLQLCEGAKLDEEILITEEWINNFFS
tara:strand:- start:1046 stop:1657 length:612 start_codon:yes stop_codon:yes gene_type:complete